MSLIEVKAPSVGESITEVVIGEWLKAPGDWVEEDENIVVVLSGGNISKERHHNLIN